MFVIEPLYAGDISIDSTYENGKVTHLVYELDDLWNGDLLIAGTDVFAVGGNLLDLLRTNEFTGFTLKEMDIIYNGIKPLPDFMQIIPEDVLKVNRGEYTAKTCKDIYLTQNVGEIAVSDRLFEKIELYMTPNTFTAHEINPKIRKQTTDEKFKYEYVIITACSTPFDLLPYDIKKGASKKGGTYIIKNFGENVYVSAPYLDCLKQFDIDIHGYMNIYDPYFLTVKGNDKESVIEIINTMCTRGFFVGESFNECFLECHEFVNQNK